MSEVTPATLMASVVDLTKPFLWIGCKKGEHHTCPGVHVKCSSTCPGIPPCTCDCGHTTYAAHKAAEEEKQEKPSWGSPKPARVLVVADPTDPTSPSYVLAATNKAFAAAFDATDKGEALLGTGGDPPPPPVVQKIRPEAPVVSPNYLNPCRKCGKPIKKTGRPGRPPPEHPGGCPSRCTKSVRLVQVKGGAGNKPAP